MTGTILFSELTTERLLLRLLKEDDAEQIFLLRSDEEVNRYIGRKRPTAIEEAHTFIKKILNGIKENKSLYWVICLKDHAELIGTICLWNFSDDKLTAEVGYELHPANHGKGIMNEALNAVIQYGFNTLHLQHIEAFTHKDNVASATLLKRNGFVLQPGRKDDDVPVNVIYRLEKTS